MNFLIRIVLTFAKELAKNNLKRQLGKKSLSNKAMKQKMWSKTKKAMREEFKEQFTFKGFKEEFLSKQINSILKDKETRKKILEQVKNPKPIKLVKDFMKSYDKKEFTQRWFAHQNRYSGFAYDTFRQLEEMRVKEWLRRLRREDKKQKLKFQRELIKKYQNGDGIGYDNFRQFKKMVNSLGSRREKEYLKTLFKEQLMLMFDSNWIAFGLYIPYGPNSKLGILALQLKNTKSQKNPSLYYEWIRVPLSVWEKLCDKANGETFWKEWYHKNKENKRYLTNKSIYWNKKKAGK